MTKLSNGWKVSEEYSTPKQSAYVKRMVEESLAMPRPGARKIPTHFNGKLIADLNAEEKNDFYFSMQQPSTQAALTRQKTRDPKDDLEWVLRPMPNCIANPDAKSLDELTGRRSLSPDEIQAFSLWRGGQKNTLGTSDSSSLTKENKERAINAFTYSNPADPSFDELKRLIESAEMDAVQPAEAPKQQTEKAPESGVLERIRLWVSGKLPDWFWQ